MTANDLALIGVGILLTVIYMAIGVGVSRMTGILKERNINLFDVFFWPIICLCYATVGDVS